MLCAGYLPTKLSNKILSRQKILHWFSGLKLHRELKENEFEISLLGPKRSSGVLRNERQAVKGLQYNWNFIFI